MITFSFTEQNYSLLCFFFLPILIKLNTSPISPLPPRSQCKAEHAGVSGEENNASVINSRKKK
jgi:hypothetical protein